jgi:S1-C subfamily serine protease
MTQPLGRALRALSLRWPLRAASGRRPRVLRGRRLLMAFTLLLLTASLGYSARLHYALEATRSGYLDTRGALASAQFRNQTAERKFRLMEEQTRSRIEALREELRGLVAGAHERQKLREQELRSAIAFRFQEADESAQAFRQIFSAQRSSILYIRTDYQVEFLNSGETKEFTAFGTGFFISPVGVGMTAQHVIYPWLYNGQLRMLEKMELARVREDSLKVTMWLTDDRVADDDGEASERYLTESAYQLGPDRSEIRVLHVSQLENVPQEVATPFGAVDVPMPKLGKGDLVVFQIMDFTRRFPAVSLSSPEQGAAPLDEVMVIGYPLSRLQDGIAKPQPSTGRVRHVGSEVLELDSPLHSGNSGGPIFNKQGRAIGLASAVLDSPVYGVAVRVEALRAAWDGVRADIRSRQAQLKEIGCYRGALDGIPGPQTWAADRCRERLLSAL